MTELFSPDASFAANIVGGVVRSALQDCGAAGVMLLAAETPEGGLAARWLRSSIGGGRVFDGTAITSLPIPDAGASPSAVRAETERAAARLFARERRLLLAHPASKTVLLLADWLPPERLLPLGDIYASVMRSMAGGCTLPDDVADLAERCGGLDRLDLALSRWLEQRRPLGEALSILPEEVQTAVAARLKENRGERRWPRCVPKLATRTLWIDVFA